jgi:hypothetical protein
MMLFKFNKTKRKQIYEFVVFVFFRSFTLPYEVFLIPLNHDSSFIIMGRLSGTQKYATSASPSNGMESNGIKPRESVA